MLWALICRSTTTTTTSSAIDAPIARVVEVGRGWRTSSMVLSQSVALTRRAPGRVRYRRRSRAVLFDAHSVSCLCVIDQAAGQFHSVAPVLCVCVRERGGEGVTTSRHSSGNTDRIGRRIG